MKAAWPWVRDALGLVWIVGCILVVLFFGSWVPA